jgi:hypothetical protein
MLGGVMQIRSKLWLTAIMATALFATAVGNASARNLSISNQNIRAVFNPIISFPDPENRLSCPVTLEGSFHTRTITKTINSLVGYITRANIQEDRCAGSGILAGARIRWDTATLPWHVRYAGFTGTLPNIARIILNLAMSMTLYNIPFVGECRYGGTARYFFVPATNELEADRTTGIPRTGGSGGAFCPATKFFEGRTRVTLLGTTTPVSVTLI